MATTADKPRHSTSRAGFQVSREGQVWLVFAFLLGLIGWYKKINITLLIAYMMIALFLLNGLIARIHARRMKAFRPHLAPVFANEPLHAAILVINRHQRAGSIEVIDTAEETSVSWFVHGGLADPREVLHQSRPPLPRGRHRCHPLLVLSGFPFGLVVYGALMKPDDREQVVLPARGQIDVPGLRRWLARAGGEVGQRRQPLRRVTSDQADVRGVRPFRPGDSVRWIHWRTTARRGEPMVREYDEPPSPALLLVVDPWLPETPDEADYRRLESALELAAAISVAIGSEDASRLTLVVPGVVIPPKPHGTAKACLLATLCPLADVKGSHDVSVPSIMTHHPRSTTRLVVSTRSRSPLVDALTHKTGRPFLAVDAGSLPAWYQSPTPQG